MQRTRLAMRTTLAVAIASLGLAASSLPLWAHHSIQGTYDISKIITIQGTVTKLVWSNPHSVLYLDVVEAGGQVVNWPVEVGSPNSLKTVGLKGDSFKP